MLCAPLLRLPPLRDPAGCSFSFALTVSAIQAHVKMRTFTTVETLQPTKRRVITLGSPKQKSPAKSGVAQEKHVAFKNPQSGKSLAGTLTEVRLYAPAKLSACPSLPSPGSQRLLVVSCSVRVLHLFECSCTDRQIVKWREMSHGRRS